MLSAQMLFDERGLAADPYMTLVDFSSTVEPAGTRCMIDDDIATGCSSRPAGAYAIRRNLNCGS